VTTTLTFNAAAGLITVEKDGLQLGAPITTDAEALEALAAISAFLNRGRKRIAMPPDYGILDGPGY